MDKTNFFLRLFPTPTFLAMPAVGLDISHQSLRVVELRATSKGVIISRTAERRIPPESAYSDGPIRDAELQKALTALKKDCNLDFVRVSLSEDKAYIFKLSVPNLPEAQLRQSIELQLEENAPITPTEVVFDFVKFPNESPDHVDVMVAVFPRKIIDEYTALLKSVGITPVAFHLSAEAVARAVIKTGDRGSYLICNLGDRSTGLSVVSDGVVQFTSTLSFGGDALTSAIEKHFAVDHEEALKIRRGDHHLKNKEAMELFYSLANAASALKDEMNRIVSYWHTHKDKEGKVGKQIEKIILCGSGSNLHRFDEYVSTGMSMRVDVANVWQNAFSFDDVIPQMLLADSLSFAGAIGLALASLPTQSSANKSHA